MLAVLIKVTLKRRNAERHGSSSSMERGGRVWNHGNAAKQM
jgi:hypothetical protein